MSRHSSLNKEVVEDRIMNSKAGGKKTFTKWQVPSIVFSFAFPLLHQRPFKKVWYTGWQFLFLYLWKTRRCASRKTSLTQLLTTWNQEMLAHLKTLTVGQLWLVLANQNIGRQYIFDQMGNLSPKRREGPTALLSNQRESRAVLSAQCTHLCTRLGNYQLCTLSFTVVTNFFLDSHPWQTNPHSIRTLLEDNQWWHSRRLINEASREKTNHFQKSHLTSPTT